MIVPALPALDKVAFGDHRAAHEALSHQWRRHPEVAPLVRLVQHRLLIESHAKLEPIGLGELFPRPRAFLTEHQRVRRVAAENAFRFVDTRVAMVRRGEAASTIDQATPLVLNALIEGDRPTGIESNAGILRATQSKWHPLNNPIQHPPPSDVAAMVEAAVDLATRAPAPAIGRAAWLGFTMLSIHPFVDGNGRTARMLVQAITSEELDLGVDWGLVEQYSLNRLGYIDSLRAGQQAVRYDPSQLDPAPFMRFSLACSTVGARLVTERLRSLSTAFRERSATTTKSELVILKLAVELWGIAELGDLASLGIGRDTILDCVGELIERRELMWVSLPPSRRAIGTVGGHGLTSISHQTDEPARGVAALSG